MGLIVVYEDAAGVRNLSPLTHWRSVWDLRCGVLTPAEKLRAAYPGHRVVFLGRSEMDDIRRDRGETVAPPPADREPCLMLSGRALFRTPPPVEGPREAGLVDGVQVFRRGPFPGSPDPTPFPTVAADAVLIDRPWDLVAANPGQIAADFARLPAADPDAARVDPGAVLMNRSAIHLGAGARIKPTAVLDAEDGPIVIGAGAVVSPHSYIQGPAVIGERSLVQPGSVIRTGTTVGPVCKVGGEIEDSIITGHSNKQHDGFLGHSVLGEWCNLGAGTTNSDLKNTYGSVRVRWPDWGEAEIDTGRMFVGLTMADHAKTAIGTRIPTGAVIGFSSNILCSRVCPKTVEDLTWLDDKGPQPLDPARAAETASRMMSRRKRTLTPSEAAVFSRVAEARKWRGA
jgi:UDP-N-acetylglucosamine diphosphorylase/glucosamine-1-phosphate N-acetyltransferase